MGKCPADRMTFSECQDRFEYDLFDLVVAKQFLVKEYSADTFISNKYINALNYSNRVAYDGA